MKTIALLLIVLVACNAAGLKKLPYRKKTTFMQVMTQVEAKMKTGGPIDAITRLLDDYVATITEEQDAHDALFERQSAECTGEFAFRSKEVEDAVAALNEAGEQLFGCREQLERAQGDLATTKNSLTDNRNYLGLVEETRKRQAQSYEATLAQYENNVQAAEEAMNILDEIWNGSAEFIQLTRHANKMFLGASKIRRSSQIAPVIAALSQLAAQDDIQADEGLLDRVKELLRKFASDTEEDIRELEENENNSIEEYNNTKARLEATIANLEENQANLEGEIQELEKCITVQQGTIQVATAKRDRNQRLWDDATQMCNDFTDEYNSATNSRKEELRLLSSIRTKVEERFGEVPEPEE